MRNNAKDARVILDTHRYLFDIDIFLVDVNEMKTEMRINGSRFTSCHLSRSLGYAYEMLKRDVKMLFIRT